MTDPVTPPAAPPAAPPVAPPAAAPATPPAAPPIAWLPEADELTIGYIQNKGWDTPAKAVDSYRNLEKTFGAEKAGRTVVVPAEGAEPAEWDAYYQKLGRPKDAAEYKLPVPDGVPKEFAESASKWMHDAGLNPKQAQTIATKWNEHIAAEAQKVNETQAVARAADVEALKTGWGAAHDENLRIAQATRKALNVSDEEVDGIAAKIGLKRTIEMFHRLGQRTGEADFVSGIPAASGVMTPAQAKSRIAELRADKGWADRYVKGGLTEKNELMRLSKLASP
jgi:hypothetical protein